MAFQEQWTNFVQNVSLLNDLKPQSAAGFNSSELNEIYKPVSTALISEQAVQEFELAIDSAESGIPEIHELEQTPPDLIVDELSTFNESMPESADQLHNLENEEKQVFVNAKSGQAKTIKDSVESVLPIPRWLNRFLDLLNEILNLVGI